MSEPQSRADFAYFTQFLLSKGYISQHPPKLIEQNISISKHQVGLPFVAWWFLITTKHSLRSKGFSNTYKNLRALVKPNRSQPASEGDLEHFERAFSLAENFFVMREAPKDCLPRSLALYRFFLACGATAEHWIGVRTLPFQAHAWVEVNGRVIRDSQKYVDNYARIAVL